MADHHPVPHLKEDEDIEDKRIWLLLHKIGIPALLLCAAVEDILHLGVPVAMLSPILAVHLGLFAGILQVALQGVKPVQLARVPAHGLFTCMTVPMSKVSPLLVTGVSGMMWQSERCRYQSSFQASGRQIQAQYMLKILRLM